MKNKIKELINSYWKFDEYQDHCSTWHDKQDLLKAIDELFNSASNESLSVRENEAKKKKCHIDEFKDTICTKTGCDRSLCYYYY